MIYLAEHDPAAARRELRTVLYGTAPVNPYLTLVEAHVLDALACRDLGDQCAARNAVEQALNLAEPDRLILPFATTGAWELLTGELAVCAGSCGPGNLHLINGLFDANRSGVPVLAIAAQIPSDRNRRGATFRRPIRSSCSASAACTASWPACPPRFRG